MASLDDLVELAHALGFSAGTEELSPEARARLGLDGAVRRGAVIGRFGSLRLFGIRVARATPPAIAHAAEALARAGRGTGSLLFALDAERPLLAVACVDPLPGGPRVRQLRIALDRPSAVAAEIVSGLAPRRGETPPDVAARAAEVLRQEGVTTRFFREFARLHARAAADLCEVPRATTGERRDLALLTLTRILFLYFVQAKGWLAGRNDFLPSLLDTALRRGHLFHRRVFEPLCFATLSAPVTERPGAAQAFGGVPFLNGGLFERHAMERRFPRAFLPNETWRALFDELFSRFHFTVRERDESDAVDPEMLGRVFENLMAEDRRRSSGTYFTPPELLRGVVRQAFEAVAADGGGSGGEVLGRPRILDPAVGSGAFLLEALRQFEERAGPPPPGETPVERRRAFVRDCLFGVDADPMAVRLAELRLWLALVVDDDADWSSVAPLPNLDQNLRQGDSLFSPLDADTPGRLPGIGHQLRVVAERRREYYAATGRQKTDLARRLRDDERALALRAADAGIADLTARLADAASVGRDLFGHRARRNGLEARRVAEWKRHRRSLLALRQRMAEGDVLPFFAYEIHLADVLERGGFDIVLGNPPWVRGERLAPSARAALAARYASFRAAGRSRGFAHLPDLSVAFVERALGLVRPGGVVALVLPAKLLRAGYAGPLRSYLRTHATVLALDDRSHAPAVGFGATVFPLVCVLRRSAPHPAAACVVTLSGASGRVIRGMATQQSLPIDPEAPRSPWLAVPGADMDAVREVLGAGPPLASRFHPRLGVKTGANDVFVRDADRAGELPADHRAPAVLGRDVGPFRIRPSAVMLAALGPGGGPARTVPAGVADYLAPHAAALRRRADGERQPPWALFRTDLLRGRWLVLWRDIAGGLESAVLERAGAAAPVPLNTCYGVLVPDDTTAHWLCAYLNSGVAGALARVLAERAGGGCYRFSASTIGALPLPDHTDTPAVRELARLGRRASDGHTWNRHDLDTCAIEALGLAARTVASLRDLDTALCRGAGRHR